MSAKRNLLIGVGIGAVLGILFAPHKGSKTRRKIAERGNELKEGWNNLKESVTNTIASIKGDADDFVDESDEFPAYINSSMQDEWKGSSVSDDWKA